MLIKPANSPRAVALSSSDEGVLVVPPAVIVPTGAVRVVFAVRATGKGEATVSANLNEKRVVAKVTVR